MIHTLVLHLGQRNKIIYLYLSLLLFSLTSPYPSLPLSLGCYLLFCMRIVDGDSIRSRLDRGRESSTAVAYGRWETGGGGYICLDLQATWRSKTLTMKERYRTDQKILRSTFFFCCTLQPDPNCFNAMRHSVTIK